MQLREQLQADLKEAMKSGDAVRKTVIRGVMATLGEEEQRKRENLVGKALKKHSVTRPDDAADESQMAAYTQAVAAALAAEKVDEASALDSGEALAVLQRLVKQHQDSLDQARDAGRQDIAEAVQRDMEILQGYLPQQLSRQEIEAEAQAIIAQVGAEGPRDMGKVMGPLMDKLKGRADGKLISEVVRALLAE